MTTRLLPLFLVSFLMLKVAVAQDASSSMPQPTKEHKWLEKFVGTWDAKSKGVMAEGQPPIESKGTIKCTMLGGFWVTNTMETNFGGMPFKGVQTIGYSTKKKKYVGTWVDMMSDYMWQYEGFVDAAGKKLVLEATGPDMIDPEKTRKYRDAYEFKSDDELIVTSSVQNDDGSWTTFMSGTSTRIKDAKTAGSNE